MTTGEKPGRHAARGGDDQSIGADTPDAGADETSGDETSGDEHEGGAEQPGADPEDAEEIEEERQERLDPDNRPDHVEVDNTDRDFDVERGMFTDSEGYEEADPVFPAAGEQGA